MHPQSHWLMRLVFTLAAFGLFAAPVPSSGSERSLPSISKIENWKLANGDLVQAAIVSYSRHHRIITLELPSGKRVHIAPRDLAGAGKFNWLTSEAFLLSLSGYRVPDEAALPLVQTILAVFAAASLGLFLTFWGAVSLLTGQRSIRRAINVFTKFFLFSLAAIVAGLTIAWGLDKLFSHNTVVTFLISAVYLITIGLILAMTCRIIGNQYGISEWTGIQALFLALLLFVIGAFVVIIGVPRAMNQPGIDEWLTERVLTPLELA